MKNKKKTDKELFKQTYEMLSKIQKYASEMPHEIERELYLFNTLNGKDIEDIIYK